MNNEWYKTNNSYQNGMDSHKVKRTRILALVILCVAVVTATAFTIRQIQSNNIIPSTKADSELPDNYQDFFNNFYSSVEDEKADISIPKYEGKMDFRVELVKDTGSEMTLQELYDKCEKQIVSIACSSNGEIDDIWGSGVVMSEDGLILTNTHVIDGCKKVSVIISDGKEYEAKLIGADEISDLSVLKIEPDDKLYPAQFADIEDLKVGDEVAAIGSPLGSTFINSLTNGIVSGIERDIPHNGHSMTLIQTNAALNEGNSGGALLNMKGQVIGITNMKMNSMTVSIEGIGFAIPSTTVKTITDELLSDGFVQRTTIGVVVGSIPQNVSNAYDLPNGLYVSEVNEGSGAADAGIKAGDVITSVNGKEVKTTSDVNAIKDTMSVGDIMKITVFRDGNYIDYNVVLK